MTDEMWMRGLAAVGAVAVALVAVVGLTVAIGDFLLAAVVATVAVAVGIAYWTR